jgi:two-component system LytT family response regulator
MRINAVIIDDEANNIDNLSLLLAKYCPQVDIAATAASGEEGKQILQRFKPDLVFLDIQMPDKTGFDILKELNEIDFEVIFVTAYDKFAIQAMKFSAVDYLLKPINIEELQSAVGRAQKRHQLKLQNNQLENLISLIRSQQNKEEHRIGLTTMKETRFVKTSQVARCEASNNYTTFYLDGGEQILVSKPIYEYEELLTGYGFIRCHQSHIINKAFVKSWVKEYGGYILLFDGTEVPVSRNKKDAVKEFLKIS